MASCSNEAKMKGQKVVKGKGSHVKQETMDDPTDDVKFAWSLVRIIADRVNCEERVVVNVVRLLDDDNTIPFIARYRKEQTNFLEPDKLREIKEQLDELREVQMKAESVVKKVEKLGKLDATLKSALLASQTVDDIDHLYAPFKPGSKRTLAERARQLGLEVFATKILSSAGVGCLHEAVDPDTEGLASLSEVEQGIQHIVADMMSKDVRIIETTRKLCGKHLVTLHSKLIKSAAKMDKKSAGKTKMKSTAKKSTSVSKAAGTKNVDVDKFQLYFDFRCSVANIKPHQVLAVNRGENLKVLRVGLTVASSIKTGFIRRCLELYTPHGADTWTSQLLGRCADDAYDRLVEPMLIRGFRSDLMKTAEKASVAVFGSNLKKLLLTPPVRWKTILGVDPGFSNGCKYALITASGEVADTGVAYLHARNNNFNKELDKIKSVILKHRCEVVAIGNGVGCRETEKFFSDVIQNGAFHPLTVGFCIVSEAGASVYSASDAAQIELSDLDISVRGAVSIARRLQDPLAELVKIDPKNLDVGMYQHDISEKYLKTALDGTVEDAVSVIGADLNVASEALLSHISGISDKLAKKIVDYRQSNGPFVNRSQLLSIAGIGPRTFEQCAGFLRVTAADCSRANKCCDAVDTTDAVTGKKRKCPSSATSGKAKKARLALTWNPLDATWIHPESYNMADRLLNIAHVDKTEIGQTNFIEKLKRFMNSSDLPSLARSLDVTEVAVQLIVDGLLQPLDADVRDHNEKPLFKRCVTSLNDVTVGVCLTGGVTNVTHFGAFVDIGVGHDGLIHCSAITRQLLPVGKVGLEVGDRVKVRVISIDKQRQRIGLGLISVSSD